jgi:hypothetical protein
VREGVEVKLLASDIPGETFWKPEELLEAYIHLTEAEEAFCIHKSDLRLRPVWHQKEERVRAHILVCFLAYVLWKALERLCSAAGLGDEPRRVLRELSTIQLVQLELHFPSGNKRRLAASEEPLPLPVRFPVLNGWRPAAARVAPFSQI